MTDAATHYRVLARKYRPQTFAELIGQEAMVRTLANAIASGRVAHAFILTGVRGVGKTTTARIIARALNCIGADGTGGPTVSPCGECEHCISIAGDRHVDVVEMDAASRTGVDDIRELTEGMRYRPVSGRFKIYIIDEVHMLSKNAFNALLKTLEEPPPDVKFVFATTEIQKVPVTVLSRCQRFSLRRVPIDQLIAHYQGIAAAEGIELAPGALGLIARAADGSVRDGLSLLDQAIALAGGSRPGESSAGGSSPEEPIAEAAVREMLGIADRSLIFDLFETVLKGDAAGALDRMEALYQGGADPLTVIQDLLDLAHFLTRLKLVPDAGAGDPMEAGDRERARPLAAQLAMPVLARAWQMLLKGIEEVQTAPSAKPAAEMILVRLAYVADLPVPAELVKSIADGDAPAAPPIPVVTTPAAGSTAGPTAMVEPVFVEPFATAPPPPMPSPSAPRRGESGNTAPVMAAPEPLPAAPPLPPVGPPLDPQPRSFAETVALFEQHGEVITRSQLRSQVHLVAFEPGHIEFRPVDGAPRDLASRLTQRLSEWTGTRWVVAVSQAAGAPTLEQQDLARDSDMKSQVAQHPLVRAVLDAFPGATIAAVRERFAAAEPASEDGAAGDEMLADGAADSEEDEP
ncbi:MAG TPA: DNA polymerase III subunit gamma/tau [Stellaceae bacterium]|nr:DNA polymerase III subunit gamma/tau [Stellaceae bacterium]